MQLSVVFALQGRKRPDDYRRMGAGIPSHLPLDIRPYTACGMDSDFLPVFYRLIMHYYIILS